MADTYPPKRPDPDALLAQINEDALSATRGKLRVYFGASAGVGKTYAMLTAARKAKLEAVDVVIGVVETHGRAETAALLDGLELLPLRPLQYRDRALHEFDLDAALLRKPQLLLVDELAHSNIEGSRHPKRWQDIDELLAAGIDVWTALNVQHLESLNDVVGGITQIRVMETVPDHVFDHADEVVLVDIPADELLKRLKAGKVYFAEQAERAARSFFRKGNLMALREIALRRTADRVEDDVQTYRDAESINKVWKTEAGLLACIGPTPSSEHVVRSAARLASQLNVSWHAVYVETPQLQRLPATEREAILSVLKLAEDLQATTAVLANASPAAALTAYASEHNLGRLVLGSSTRPQGWWVALMPWRGSRHVSELVGELEPDLDRIHVGRAQDHSTRPLAKLFSNNETGSADAQDVTWSSRWMRYVWTLLGCAVTTALCFPISSVVELSNVAMVFLLGVVLVAMRFGRTPAAMAAVINVLAFDFFFVPPRFSFAISDVQYLLTFAIMLVVGLITGNLTAGLRFQARIAAHRETRVHTLFNLSRDLSSALHIEQVISVSTEMLARTFGRDVALVLPDATERLRSPSLQAGQNLVDIDIAQWAFDHDAEAGYGTDTLPSSHYRYVLLKAPVRLRGVLAIRPANARWLHIPEQRRYIETFASVIAIALERVHFVQVAQSMLVNVESERLRNSLLAALSHDLRTPLTALVGLTESLSNAKLGSHSMQKELADEIRTSALRMHTMVNNLLDMARLQSGEVHLRKDWQSIEEVVGGAIRSLQPILKGRAIEVKLPDDLPLVEMDAVLMERVFANLLENATKYTPDGSAIAVSATARPGWLTVSVADRGPGLPVRDATTLFDKFTRGEQESAKPGVGLGLSICRAIVGAHGGKIHASQREGGGAVFSFDLPTTPMVNIAGDAHVGASASAS